MSTKELVILIIREEMRLKQYVFALRKLGIEFVHFELDLINAVSRLMQVDMTDSWMEFYLAEINKCEYLTIEPFGKNLKPLAEVCYHTLLEFSKSNDDPDRKRRVL